MKAGELVNRAYNLSGIVARDLDQVQGGVSSQGADGIFWLNQLLAEKMSDGNYLPFYTHYNFNAVIGQQEYLLPNMVSVDCITFYIGATRYSMNPNNRRRYWGESRQDNIESLPYQFYYEKTVGGINVFFYFLPQSTYPMIATGLVGLPSVIESTNLDTTLDQYYQLYLMFELAEYLCMWNQISLPPATQKRLDEFRSKLYNINPLDVTLEKQSLLSGNPLLTYAQINLGKGWTP